ncbi:MAG: right-handed parallel beta-helix repeat-containing protein [Planctomycetaceae bacterium]|nr:right-handed parallel beta-helix repeat-containing protein [Planctomycetaceae bacterium]
MKRSWKLGLIAAAMFVSPLAMAAEPVAKVSKTPLVLREGGTPDKPAVFDGQGMVIDLGIDVTDEGWKKSGDIWTSHGPLQERAPQPAGDFPGLFVDEIPLVIPRDREAEKQHPDRVGRCYLPAERLAPGQMGYAADGSFYFRWPKGKHPQGSTADANRIILPPKPGISCVTIACSHIIVKNITAKHASNDGFNIHNKWVGIRVENVRGFSNCDEGISAHDDVQMDVVDSEFAWNGSQAGGVADVNRCTTTYRNCRIHDNVGAAFHFTGKSHKVSDIVIYNQTRDFHIGPETHVERERVEWRK